MALDPYQQQIVRTALVLPEADDFALAGGGAMLAHQLIERPTQDIDLFTTHGRSAPELTRALAEAMTATGSSVTVVQQSDTFARLQLVSPEGMSTTVDLVQDARLADAVRLDIGPVLALQDVIADKTLALWGRAEARDLIDVDALATRFGRDLLLRLAAAKDAGFDPARMPAALTTAAGRAPTTYASLGVTGSALDQLRARSRSWADQLTEQQATVNPRLPTRAGEPSRPPDPRSAVGRQGPWTWLFALITSRTQP
ncbi:hypothetical protein DQ238_11960 [Geodermatophilus sp. TF02-6]|uniref:nucleotidyl transferase AbiEii/AbiGii toxin family protein n=1 Tax=Geodermatophilus sp. TF02-6 TaxID=2250575 RepID=UPI000DEB6791|nr:nucleotidyl transferase AbiEii/AbiGii toxin family protein [Geodermatophilus sp. TF02-6]RBY78768.1 hypothetical protein DQ238_11960 [Geodermatophilus sp. TF02-6]